MFFLVIWLISFGFIYRCVLELICWFGVMVKVGLVVWIWLWLLCWDSV